MKHFYKNVPGYATDTLRRIYQHMVEIHQDGARFVELGTFYGNSTVFMAVEIINSGKDIKFDAIDTLRGSLEHQEGKGAADKTIVAYGNMAREYNNNIAPVNHIVRTLMMTTNQALDFYNDESIDFLFHDASHEYEDVVKDLRAWMPKIKIGGLFGGHDAEFPGVKQALIETFDSYQLIGDSWMIKRI